MGKFDILSISAVKTEESIDYVSRKLSKQIDPASGRRVCCDGANARMDAQVTKGLPQRWAIY